MMIYNIVMQMMIIFKAYDKDIIYTIVVVVVVVEEKIISNLKWLKCEW